MDKTETGSNYDCNDQGSFTLIKIHTVSVDWSYVYRDDKKP